MSKNIDIEISNKDNTNIVYELDLLVKNIQYKLNKGEIEKEDIQKYRFKLRHFKNALKIVKMYPEKITKGDDLKDISGIGKGIISRILPITEISKLTIYPI